MAAFYQKRGNNRMIVTKQELDRKMEEARKNAYAAYDVAEYYYVQKDYKIAFEWYRKAASGDNPVPMALYALGYACQMGEGTPVDLLLALHYYEAAAKYDVPQALYNLAFFYQNGLVVKQDQAAADAYSERASRAMTKQVEELQREKEQVQELQRSYDAAVHDFAQKSDAWQELAQQRAGLEGKIAELGGKVSQEKARCADLQAQKKDDDKRFRRLLAEHESLLKTLSDQLSKYESAQAEIKIWQDRYGEQSRIAAARQGELECMTADREQMAEELSVKRAAEIELTRGLDEKQRQIDDRQQKIDELQERVRKNNLANKVLAGVAGAALLWGIIATMLI